MVSCNSVSWTSISLERWVSITGQVRLGFFCIELNQIEPNLDIELNETQSLNKTIDTFINQTVILDWIKPNWTEPNPYLDDSDYVNLNKKFFNTLKVHK